MKVTGSQVSGEISQQQHDVKLHSVLDSPQLTVLSPALLPQLIAVDSHISLLGFLRFHYYDEISSPHVAGHLALEPLVTTHYQPQIERSIMRLL